VTTWIFARHGQSTANVVPMLSGHMDVPLTDVGREQARALGEAIRPLRITRGVASDLSRAYDTAAIALTGRPHAIRAVPALRERALGDWTGIHHDDLVARGGVELLSTLDGAPPGGESLRDVALRVTQYLTSLDDEMPTMVVAHGGVLRALLGLLDAAPAVRVQKAYVPNAAPHLRTIAPGTWASLHRALRHAPPGGTP